MAGRGAAMLLAGWLFGSGLMGCARVLTITQDDYINTAMHVNRPLAARTGEPLEIDIVCVTPTDLKHEANAGMAPDANITSAIWFRDRPIPGDKKDMEDRGGRFWLPKSQISLLTFDKKCYGTLIGDPLCGAATDKKREAVKTFSHAGALHDKDSVIYVFGKFIDKNGGVLPVPPAKFHPPGAYTEKLCIKIGVDESRANYGQYIDNTTERKLHGSSDDH